MSSYLYRRQDRIARDQQPFQFVDINPYWKQYSPIVVVTPYRFLNMVDGRFAPTLSATPTVTTTRPATTSWGTAGGYSLSGSGADPLFRTEGTMLWAGTLPANTFILPVCELAVPGANNYISFVHNPSAWDGRLRAEIRANGVDQYIFSPTQVQNGQAVALSGGPAGTFMAQGGVLLNSSTSTAWAANFSTLGSRWVAINFLNRGASNTSSYSYSICAFFARQIPPIDLITISRNPWVLYKNDVQKARLYFLPSQGAPVFLPHFARHSNIVIGASINA